MSGFGAQRYTANMPALIGWMARAQPGQRNDRLFGAALCALNAGYDTGEIEQAARDTGLSWYEIHQTVRSARRYART